MFRSLFTIYNTGEAISYICLSLTEHLAVDSDGVEAWFPASETRLKHHFIRNAYPRWAMPFVCRLPRAQNVLEYGVERAFLQALQPGDTAYLWPGVSLNTYREIWRRKITIVTERINCHTRYAKQILDKEFARLDITPSHGITDEAIKQEENELDLADFIYAPSDLVVESLVQCGVPLHKIIRTSFGWDPKRILGKTRLLEPVQGVTALFAGGLNVRKGVHLALDAWREANVGGRFVFSGKVAPDVEEHFGEELTADDIIILGHVSDMGSVYRSADFFVFPTLEEGSPLVTYEAMACGLPVIVSPMGAGPARDGIDGFIIDPHDTEAWTVAIRRLAGDPELRKIMGESARKRAEEFTWEKVGERRRDLLKKAISLAGG